LIFVDFFYRLAIVTLAYPFTKLAASLSSLSSLKMSARMFFLKDDDCFLKSDFEKTNKLEAFEEDRRLMLLSLLLDC